MIKTYKIKDPKIAAFLAEAFDDITAALALPLKCRKSLGTTNGVEMIKQKIHRKDQVIRIFPNDASVIPLMIAQLMK